MEVSIHQSCSALIGKEIHSELSQLKVFSRRNVEMNNCLSFKWHQQFPIEKIFN